MRSTRLSATDDDRGALAVSYLRVSTPRQLNTGSDVDADGDSIATQRIETSGGSDTLIGFALPIRVMRSPLPGALRRGQQPDRLVLWRTFRC